MNQSTVLAIPVVPTSVKTLQLIGGVGSVLAFAILGASILLRLTTVFSDDGAPLSTLATDTENAVRLVHRLAASGVGLLALVASFFCWIWRRDIPHAVKPIAWLVGATVLLALIGPLTPGYRYGVVTVANVVAGTVLLAACWWLHERLTVWPAAALTQPSLRIALCVLILHVGLGAATSAYAMRGTHWVAFVHSGTAMLTTLLLGSILWDRRMRPELARLVGVMAALLGVQLVLGLVSLWLEVRPLGLGFMHAMLSPILAAGLVSISVRDGSGLSSAQP